MAAITFNVNPKQANMPVAQQGWCVYDVETDEVIGKWDKYEDAMQFWGDVLNCDDINWCVFPASEVPDSE